MIGRKAAGVFRTLVNAEGLQFDCVRMFHEALLVPALLYGSETVISNGLAILKEWGMIGCLKGIYGRVCRWTDYTYTSHIYVK